MANDREMIGLLLLYCHMTLNKLMRNWAMRHVSVHVNNIDRPLHACDGIQSWTGGHGIILEESNHVDDIEIYSQHKANVVILNSPSVIHATKFVGRRRMEKSVSRPDKGPEDSHMATTLDL
jgi:hypothetical protein